MKRASKPVVKYEGPIFPVGSDVSIARPHLWAGCSGTVVAVDNGLHRVKIVARDNVAYPSGFHTEVGYEELNVSI